MLKSILCATTLVVTSTLASAGGWSLDNDTSKIQFGSIKKDYVGESHSFEDVSGSVSEDGAVSITIDLSSVQTWIDIRNERMIEHVFKGAQNATLTAQMDMSDLNDLAVGDTTLVDVEGNLSLLGVDTEIFTEMFVARLADDKVIVLTDELLFLRADDAGLDTGIDMLMKLAKLPGITRTAPVSLRLVFQKS